MIIYFIFGFLFFAFCFGIYYIYTLNKKLITTQNELIKLNEANMKLLSQKKSSEVRVGQIAEQLAPFLENFKYDPKKIKFIGMPIDYIYFGDDEIVVIEIKSGNSQLSTVQKNIKDLVDNKKIRWEVYRIK
jgi:predicted Holliday junction resolvase-like endonuclease